MDSGSFHEYGFGPASPMTPDSQHVSFTTPSGNITCTGDHSWLVCDTTSRTLPRPPQPVDKPPGNWEPYLELSPRSLTYGVAAGNPMVPSHASTLPYGSTLRFGEFCGALVSDAAILGTSKSLPNDGGLKWTEVSAGDFYTCNDIQLFELDTKDPPLRHELPYVPTYVLVFYRGRLVASATDHPYPALSGDVDAHDPTLIHLFFHVLSGGKESTADIRARYQNGAITLLDPIPVGADPST